MSEPYTLEVPLCDNDGMVRRGAMHHGNDYLCTGSAHYAGDHIKCTSPAHEPIKPPARPFTAPKPANYEPYA